MTAGKDSFNGGKLLPTEFFVTKVLPQNLMGIGQRRAVFFVPLCLCDDLLTGRKNSLASELASQSRRGN